MLVAAICWDDCNGIKRLSHFEQPRYPFREPLDGSPRDAAIEFECLYESYDTEVQSPPGWKKIEGGGSQLSWQSLPKTKSRYQSQSRDDDHGILSVRVIAAYNLVPCRGLRLSLLIPFEPR